jgi:hypothetical protein
MKHTSSATDSRENAVCSRGESPSSALHRVRTIGPSGGMVAPPRIPGRNSTQSGARSCTARISPATLTTKTATSGNSTRCCPRVSTRRAICGAQTAQPIEPAADTLPATPYLPVTAEMSSTVPRPYMDIGMRPMTAATENRHARGILKISAYGNSSPRGPPILAECASSTLVIGCVTSHSGTISGACNTFLAGPCELLFPGNAPR